MKCKIKVLHVPATPATAAMVSNAEDTALKALSSIMTSLAGIKTLDMFTVNQGSYCGISNNIEFFDGVPAEIARQGIVIGEHLAAIMATANVSSIEIDATAEELKLMQSAWSSMLDATANINERFNKPEEGKV